MGNIRIAPLSAGLGAEISGVDLRAPLDAGAVAAIEQAWYDHLVILIRDQNFYREATGIIGKRGIEKQLICCHIREVTGSGLTQQESN